MGPGDYFELLPLLLILAAVGFFVWRGQQRAESAKHLYAPADVTRLALGSLLLRGPLLRGEIIRRTANPFRAQAPEPGMDIELVAAAARRFDDEDQGYWWTLAALTVGLLLFVRPPGITLLWLAGIIFVALRRRWRIRFKLAERFTEGKFDPAALRRELGLSEAPANTAGAQVICHGTAAPFDGLGVNIGGWNLAFDLLRPATGKDTVAGVVSAEAMDQAITEAVRKLSLDGLKIDETMFVSGAQGQTAGVQADAFTQPSASASEAQVGPFRHGGHPGVRVYRRAAVTDWAGELIFSYLFRCQTRGNVMSVEAVQLVLTPADDIYREIDHLRVHGFLEGLRWWMGAVMLIPVDVVVAFFTIARRTAVVVDEALLGGVAARERREIQADPAYNYGSVWSLRTHMASRDYASYFQKVDAAQYFHAVNAQVLNAVGDTLRAHGVDAGDLEAQATLIQNNTVQISATRDVSLSGVAIGQNAKAQTGALAGIARAVTPGGKT